MSCKNSCYGCPINITTEHGEYANNVGCLPSYADIIKWYKETGKVWGCHETAGKTPCLGFLKIAKGYGEHISVNKNTILITESCTLEDIYKDVKTVQEPT